MAKPKPAKGAAPDRSANLKSANLKGDLKIAVPCLLLVVFGIALLGLLFSAMLKSASQ